MADKLDIAKFALDIPPDILSGMFKLLTKTPLRVIVKIFLAAIKEVLAKIVFVFKIAFDQFHNQVMKDQATSAMALLLVPIADGLLTMARNLIQWLHEFSEGKHRYLYEYE